MALWTFRDYTSESGDNVIVRWVEAIKPPKRRWKMIARWDAFLEHIQNLEPPRWPSEWFTELKGFPRILEMKFTVQNIQFRPLGYFGPHRHEFTFLVGAIEKNNRFVPLNAPELAIEHKNIVEANPARAIEHELPVDDDAK
jgi:hypothetical protein